MLHVFHRETRRRIHRRSKVVIIIRNSCLGNEKGNGQRVYYIRKKDKLHTVSLSALPALIQLLTPVNLFNDGPRPEAGSLNIGENVAEKQPF
jgi:hypothetical protein